MTPEDLARHKRTSPIPLSGDDMTTLADVHVGFLSGDKVQVRREVRALVEFLGERLPKTQPDDKIYGHNHPRARWLFPGEYPFRCKDGTTQEQRAAKFIAKCVKRGYV